MCIAETNKFKRLKESLRRERDIGRLAQSLGLAERMHVVLLVCSRPAQADAALAVLEEEVRRLRDDRVEWIRVAPRGKSTVQSLAAEVQKSLETVLDEKKNTGKVWVIDASGVKGEDEEKIWLQLFNRMNERRNEIINNLPGSLLLVLTPPLEYEFAFQAPDFWSVKSMVARATALPEENIPVYMDRGPMGEENNVETDKAELRRFVTRSGIAGDDIKRLQVQSKKKGKDKKKAGDRNVE